MSPKAPLFYKIIWKNTGVNQNIPWVPYYVLMGGHDIVVILKEVAIYPSSKVKELSNGTQQAPLGTFTQSVTYCYELKLVTWSFTIQVKNQATFSKPDRHQAPSALRWLDPRDDVIVTEGEARGHYCIILWCLSYTYTCIHTAFLLTNNIQQMNDINNRLIIK